MGGLALLGGVVTIAPGVLVYVLLRAVGLGIGGAGLIGLLLEFIGCFAYCGWLFGGGRSAGAARSKSTSSEGDS